MSVFFLTWASHGAKKETVLGGESDSSDDFPVNFEEVINLCEEFAPHHLQVFHIGDEEDVVPDHHSHFLLLL